MLQACMHMHGYSAQDYEGMKCEPARSHLFTDYDICDQTEMKSVRYYCDNEDSGLCLLRLKDQQSSL